jgi:hypothetical protein
VLGSGSIVVSVPSFRDTQSSSIAVNLPPSPPISTTRRGLAISSGRLVASPNWASECRSSGACSIA